MLVTSDSGELSYLFMDNNIFQSQTWSFSWTLSNMGGEVQRQVLQMPRKIAKQQSQMFNSKLETEENLYSKRMETHNDFFLQL